jgi:hypothetical protein
VIPPSFSPFSMYFSGTCSQMTRGKGTQSVQTSVNKSGRPLRRVSYDPRVYNPHNLLLYDDSRLHHKTYLPDMHLRDETYLDSIKQAPHFYRQGTRHSKSSIGFRARPFSRQYPPSTVVDLHGARETSISLTFPMISVLWQTRTRLQVTSTLSIHIICQIGREDSWHLFVYFFET